MRRPENNYLSAEGKGGRHIRQWFEDNNVRTRGDKVIPLSMIYRMLGSSFYYGEFEYPKGSGKWYKGNHEPLIAKDLFDKVQKQLRVPTKTKWGSKEFPFKRFMTCYSCGSSLVGEEKFKARQDGAKKKFTYYHCSRQVDHNCKEPYAREEDIIEQLVGMCDELIESVKFAEPGLRDAVDKFTRMMMIAHPKYDKEYVITSYIKYVLYEGTAFERNRLVRNLNTKDIKLHNKLLIHARNDERIVLNDVNLLHP